MHDLHLLFENIEDDPNNVTRFFVISREPARRSGDDKTAIMFTTAHKPGRALAEVLDVFRDNGVNLTDVEKRPSKKVNWEYYFFIDAQGHVDDPGMKSAIDSRRRKHCLQLTTVLGSYPRKRRRFCRVRAADRFVCYIPQHPPRGLNLSDSCNPL